MWQLFSKAQCFEFHAMGMIENNWHMVEVFVKNPSQLTSAFRRSIQFKFKVTHDLAANCPLQPPHCPLDSLFMTSSNMIDQIYPASSKDREVLDKTDAGNFAELSSAWNLIKLLMIGIHLKTFLFYQKSLYRFICANLSEGTAQCDWIYNTYNFGEFFQG